MNPPAPYTPTSTLWEIITQMDLHGGEFVRRLASTFRAADAENKQRLITAFPEIIERYDALAAGESSSQPQLDLDATGKELS